MNRKNNTGIARKEKACCANCKNIGICVLPSSECNYCSLYKGNGATPEQMLEELKRRNVGLNAKLKRYQKKYATYIRPGNSETNMPIYMNGAKIAEQGNVTPFKKITEVIKPITWGEEKYNSELSFKFEESPEAQLYQIRCYFRNEVVLGVWFGKSAESTVAKAQAWLNTLVEQCLVSNVR